MSLVRKSFLDARAATLLVLVLLVLGAGAVVADAWLTTRAAQDTLAILESRVVHMETRAASIAGAETKENGSGLDNLKLLMTGRTQGLASAAFQREIADLATGSGAVVRTVDTPQVEKVEEVADEFGNPLMRVRLNANVEVMEQSLPQLLHAIEVSLPVIVVDFLAVRPNRRIENVTGDSGTSAGDRPLSLSMTLSSFRIGERD